MAQIDIDAAAAIALATARQQHGIVSNSLPRDLEAQGWEVWLRTLAPDSFTAPFSDEHCEFWDHFWQLLQARKRGEQLAPADRNIVLPLNRGGGKSTVAEMAAIAEGCILGNGFVLYLSDSQLLAEEHLFSIKSILENGHFAKYYPKMAKPKVSSSTNTQAKFTQDTIITECGWGMTARGILGNVRGGRQGTLRFTLVINDDIDSLNDSLMVIEKKKRIIARSVFPAMDKNRGVTIFAQNLITKNSVVSQIVNRTTDILAERLVIGGGKGVPAFDELVIGTQQRPDGSTGWVIETAVPRWPYFNIEDAKAFLALSGKDAFLAEYQHQFEDKKGRVISQYDRETQVITWSEFEKVFGVRHIPQHWTASVGLDVGFSDGAHPHYSAWDFVAVSPLNSPLPNRHFVYRSRTFTATSIDDQAISIWRDMMPNGSKVSPEWNVPFKEYDPLRQHFGANSGERGGIIKHWQMSHEASGVMLTLNQRYGLPFVKVKHYGSSDGVAQWNTLSLPDYTRHHPFKDDDVGEDGKYWLGSPNLYYIVDDDQYHLPINDNGMKTALEQIEGWEWVKVKILESGLTSEKPSKVNDDHADVIKGLIRHLQAAQPTPLTRSETFEAAMPVSYTIAEMRKRSPYKNGLTDGQEMARALMESEVRERTGIERDRPHWESVGSDDGW